MEKSEPHRPKLVRKAHSQTIFLSANYGHSTRQTMVLSLVSFSFNSQNGSFSLQTMVTSLAKLWPLLSANYGRFACQTMACSHSKIKTIALLCYDVAGIMSSFGRHSLSTDLVYMIGDVLCILYLLGECENSHLGLYFKAMHQ